jgi:hypothetical protein
MSIWYPRIRANPDTAINARSEMFRKMTVNILADNRPGVVGNNNKLIDRIRILLLGTDIDHSEGSG